MPGKSINHLTEQAQFIYEVGTNTKHFYVKHWGTNTAE